jgi:hypothetical protein
MAFFLLDDPRQPQLSTVSDARRKIACHGAVELSLLVKMPQNGFDIAPIPGIGKGDHWFVVICMGSFARDER